MCVCCDAIRHRVQRHHANALWSSSPRAPCRSSERTSVCALAAPVWMEADEACSDTPLRFMSAAYAAPVNRRSIRRQFHGLRWLPPRAGDRHWDHGARAGGLAGVGRKRQSPDRLRLMLFVGSAAAASEGRALYGSSVRRAGRAHVQYDVAINKAALFAGRFSLQAAATRRRLLHCLLPAQPCPVARHAVWMRQGVAVYSRRRPSGCGRQLAKGHALHNTIGARRSPMWKVEAGLARHESSLAASRVLGAGVFWA